MFDELVPLRRLRRGIAFAATLDRHIPEFDREVYNLIWNGLYDSLHGQIASITEDTGEEDAALLHGCESFTYVIHLLGLMNLLERRLAAIAEDIFLTGRTDKVYSIDEKGSKREIKMIDSSKSDGTQCVFLIDSLRDALANSGAEEDDLVKRLRSLKCLRDLIVHPRSFIFEVDDSGNFQEIPTKQHKYVSETLPDAINSRGNIVIDGALI